MTIVYIWRTATGGCESSLTAKRNDAEKSLRSPTEHRAFRKGREEPVNTGQARQHWQTKMGRLTGGPLKSKRYNRSST
jgi:hypothetical protein